MAKLLENGNILIPVRVEGENGVIGDAIKEITPEDPEYAEWLPFASK